MRKNKIIIVCLIILCSTAPFFRGCTGPSYGEVRDQGFSFGFPFSIIAIYFHKGFPSGPVYMDGKAFYLHKDLATEPIYIEDVNMWILLVDLVIIGFLLLLFMAKQKYQNILLRLKWGILLNTFLSWGVFAAMYIGAILQSSEIFNIGERLSFPYIFIFTFLLLKQIPILFLDILMRLTFLLISSLLAILISFVLYLIKQNLTTQSS